MDWSAARYTRFEDERTRPARDLVDRIPTRAAARTVDLGCGPGNSTALLVARYPEADTLGVDSSPDMLAAARARLPGVRFERGRHRRLGRPGAVRRHPRQRLAAMAARPRDPLPGADGPARPGGSLAVQMPDNLDEPTHRLMRETAAHPDWREGSAAPRPPAPPATTPAGTSAC